MQNRILRRIQQDETPATCARERRASSIRPPGARCRSHRPGSYDWLMQYGKGYSARINSILRTVMERAR